MIPLLDTRGLLPVGIHSATIDEINASHLCDSAYRAEIFSSLLKFMRIELLPACVDFYIDIGGSFVTDKPIPTDIDVTLRIPILSIADAAQTMQSLGNIAGRQWVYNEYRVDFYFTLEGCGNDFSAFFQYVGDKTGAQKQLPSTELKGILRIQL